MNDPEEFYRLRDQRTHEYVGSNNLNRLPVEICLENKLATTRAGQLLILSLANLLARVHTDVTFVLTGENIPLVESLPFTSENLNVSIVRTCQLIDPYGRYAIKQRQIDGPKISYGIGSGDFNCEYYVSVTGAIVEISTKPIVVDSAHSASLIGAGLGACLTAAYVFRQQLEKSVTPRRVSAWNFLEGANAGLGPNFSDKIDVGNVATIGAGAVAAGLGYWLSAFGATGEWTFVDRDVVKLHNTNRGMLFLPSDAGWKSGVGKFKAQVVANFIPNARSVAEWYHDWKQGAEKFDVFLVLANEHDVRTSVASRNTPLVLHATTGENWLSECHRHIPGKDDCIRCRTADIRKPSLECSTAAISTNQNSSSADAALPFLSAASGLMLAVLLQRLQAGELSQGEINNWQWDFDNNIRIARQHVWRCRGNCTSVIPLVVRQKINVGTRWASLDEVRQ